MKYFLIHCSEDGISVHEYTAEELEKELNDPEPIHKIDDFTDKIPSYDPNYWRGKAVLIKGEIVVPKVKEVVTKVTLE